MRRLERLMVAGTAACALLLSACAGSGERRGPEVGQPAPGYTAVTLDGDSVSLEGVRTRAPGGKVVLLNLWATWCAPCRAETPFLQSLYEEHRDRGLEIVGISMDTRNALPQVREFVDEFGVTYTILHDGAMVGMELYQVLGLPATFLMDRDGVIRWMMYGPVSETNQTFLNALEDALQ